MQARSQSYGLEGYLRLRGRRGGQQFKAGHNTHPVTCGGCVQMMVQQMERWGGGGIVVRIVTGKHRLCPA